MKKIVHLLWNNVIYSWNNQKYIESSAVAVIVKALQFLAKWSSVLGSTPAQTQKEKLVKPRPLDCGCRFKCDPYWICTTWVSILKKTTSLIRI